MKLKKFIITFFFVQILAAGCSTTTKEWGYSDQNENSYGTFYKRGNASFYDEKWTGKKTANGERFDSDLLTAASRTLPFNTKVLVKDIKTNRYVIVRINDRGPYVTPDRVIDLSKAAAAKLGIYKRGIARVDIYILNNSI